MPSTETQDGDRTATTILEDVVINEGSLVDKGDNPEAHVALFKRDENDQPEDSQGFFSRLWNWARKGAPVAKGDYELPSTEQILARDSFRDQFEKLRNALMESVSGILAMAEPDQMPALLSRSVAEFGSRVDGLAGQVGKADAEAMRDLSRSLDAALNGADKAQGIQWREAFASALEDVQGHEITTKSADDPALGSKETQPAEEETVPQEKQDPKIEENQTATTESNEAAMAPAENTVKASADSVSKAEFVTMQKALDAAQAKIDKMEAAERASTFMAKAKGMDAPGVEIDTLAAVLEKADAAGIGEELGQVLAALVAQAQAGDALTKSIGNEGIGDSGENTAHGRLEGIAKEIAAKDGLTLSAAYVKAMDLNPELAEQAAS